MNEKDLEFYNKGVKAGKEHSEPSPLTLKTLQTLETVITKIEDKIDKFSCDIKSLTVELAQTNVNIRYSHETEQELKERTKKLEDRTTSLEMERYGLAKMTIVASIFITILTSTISYIYTRDRLTVEQIREIVRDERKDRITIDQVKNIVVEVINSNYK